MGWSLSWAALKGGDVQTACAALDLQATGKREGIAKSRIAGAALPTGWYVVVFNRSEIKNSILEKLSRAGEVIGCCVEDHVMFSSAANWKNGRQIWRVLHDGGEDKVFHLETSGALSPEFEGIREEMFAKQEQENAGNKEVDYVFEIPAQLAKKLTGFQHDDPASGLLGEVFETLERESMLGKLFGRLGQGKKNAA